MIVIEFNRDNLNLILCHQWFKLPGRLDREKALLKELRSQDFFLSDGEGDGELLDAPACSGGEADDRELNDVSCDVRLETESFESWRESCSCDTCDDPAIPLPIPQPLPDFRIWSMCWRMSCSSFSWKKKYTIRIRRIF